MTGETGPAHIFVAVVVDLRCALAPAHPAVLDVVELGSEAGAARASDAAHRAVPLRDPLPLLALLLRRHDAIRAQNAPPGLPTA